MERAIFPMKVMNITQRYGVGTHRCSFAVDNAGKDAGKDPVFAPFECCVKKIYKADANEVWVESLQPVQYADGTEDYMTLMLAHDDDVSHLQVGQILHQGQEFYREGAKGMATGNHIHLECGRGKFTGSGWFRNKAGYWGILNAKKPEECLWVPEDVKILQGGGLVWRRTTLTRKPDEHHTETFKVGDTVQIIGPYAAGATGKAVYTAARGMVRYVTRVVGGTPNPYQLGVQPGKTAGRYTTGFAPAASISHI